jgi:hypothetical protein
VNGTCRRIEHGAVALPDARSIDLHRDGSISFRVLDLTPSEDGASALSTLFSQLLGVDDTRAHAGWSHVPGEVQTPWASPTLSTGNEDAFRIALSRFAGHDADVLPAVFERAKATVVRSARKHGSRPAERSSRSRPSRERRHSSVSASDLRQEIRTLERQLFELQRPRRFIWRSLANERAARTVAACAALILTVATATIAMTTLDRWTTGTSNRWTTGASREATIVDSPAIEPVVSTPRVVASTPPPAAPVVQAPAVKRASLRPHRVVTATPLPPEPFQIVAPRLPSPAARAASPGSPTRATVPFRRPIPPTKDASIGENECRIATLSRIFEWHLSGSE